MFEMSNMYQMMGRSWLLCFDCWWREF